MGEIILPQQRRILKCVISEGPATVTGGEVGAEKTRGGTNGERNFAKQGLYCKDNEMQSYSHSKVSP